MVDAGVYRESIVMKRSGEPGRPIVFEGQRGPKGEWLTIVDRSVPVTGWQPAPEVGPGVFKTTSLGFAPYSMTLDGKQLARIRDDFMAGQNRDMSGQRAEFRRFWESTYREPQQVGIGLLRMASDAVVKLYHTTGELPYWDGVEVLYGHRNGTTYVRFRRGDDPNRLELSAAEQGGGFLLADKGFVVIRNFLVRGAQDSVVMKGPNASHNVVEGNFLTNGRCRVAIRDGASHNVIQNNELTLNYHGFNDPGAWSSDWQTRRTAIRQHVYLQFKYTVGHNSSDDVGIQVLGGDDNVIRGNHIYAGLLGVECEKTRNVRVCENIIHNMSSIGLITNTGVVDGEFHDNLIYDCNINLRLHDYNHKGDRERREYHYRNRFYQPEGLGSHIYNHWWDGGMPPDADHPQIFVYHNSFSGGQMVLRPSGYATKGGGMARTRFLNNIFSSATAFSMSTEFANTRSMIAACDYNWVGGAFTFGTPAWFGAHNVDARGQRLWKPGAMPDFVLAGDSPARGRGLDLSRHFVLDGETHGPLPGMKPGYFQGSAPDLGALQYGEKPHPMPSVAWAEK